RGVAGTGAKGPDGFGPAEDIGEIARVLETLVNGSFELAAQAEPRPERDDAKELLRMPDRERTKQQRVEGAEDEYIGADAEGQQQHDGQGDAAILAEEAEGEAEVLSEVAHWRSIRGKVRGENPQVPRKRRGGPALRLCVQLLKRLQTALDGF